MKDSRGLTVKQAIDIATEDLQAEIKRMRPVFLAAMARFREKNAEFGGIDKYLKRVRTSDNTPATRKMVNACARAARSGKR